MARMPDGAKLGIRWTIGDVSARGFEALRLSAWGAWKLFGPQADYAICANSIPLEQAHALTGEVPEAVRWHAVDDRVPAFLKGFLDDGLAEGMAWKLAPPRLFPDGYELALDNDCILWELPQAIAAWLEAGDGDRCLLAEDVRACFGQFAGLCGPQPLNAGIRGMPPRFDLTAALRRILEIRPVMLRSELDEQGLQIAALSLRRAPRAVSLDDVMICSPFPPHRPDLGRCGAHFVGLNVKHVPWAYHGRPGVECIADNWERHRPALYDMVGITLPEAAAPTTG